nr:MAG TPA: RteC protein [Caudoviricetes sp.]
MDTLVNTPFIQALTNYDKIPISTKKLDIFYNEFIIKLIELCDNSSDYKYLFRILTYTQIQIEILHPANKKSIVVKYITATDKVIESELRLLNERIAHPSLFQQPVTTDIPELYWSTNFSKRDLVELLTGIEYLGPILNAVGKTASFSMLVTIAEKTLHISLPNAYKIRDEVLNRKTKSADFLKRLIDALIEKSVKQ